MKLVENKQVLEPTIQLGEHGMVNGFWHCFGHRQPAVDIDTVRAMLDASGTKLLPINTHLEEPTIGHGDVTWEKFVLEADDRDLIPCLNINLQTSAAKAIMRAVRAHEETGIRLLKLEVLNDDLVTSNDEACFAATMVLVEEGFTVMPLFSSQWLSYYARRGLSHDLIPVLRIMGGPIGSGNGIIMLDHVRRACERPFKKPIILDGGLGSIQNARQALELGCDGFLINSCLFSKHGPGPVETLRQFREAFA